MIIFTRNGDVLDPNKQYRFDGQILPSKWMLTADDKELLIYNIIKTEEADPVIELEPIKRFVTPAVFRSLFTNEEKLKITQAGMSDPLVRMLTDDAMASVNIDLDYQPVIDGINYFVSLNLITKERAIEILAGEIKNEI